MGTINDYARFGFLLQGYQASEQATNTTNTNIVYFGFVGREGDWYIQEQTTDGTTLQWRYDKGDDAFATAWAARQSGTYQQWDTEFK